MVHSTPDRARFGQCPRPGFIETVAASQVVLDDNHHQQQNEREANLLYDLHPDGSLTDVYGGSLSSKSDARRPAPV